MSSIGTSIAAGVAQTAYQAGEVATRKKKKTADQDRKSQRISDEFEQHMLALDEGDHSETSNQLRVGEQLPKHQAELPEPVHAPSNEPAVEAIIPDEPATKHLDVQG